MAIKITNTSIYIDHLSVMLPANKIQTLEGEKNNNKKLKRTSVDLKAWFHYQSHLHYFNAF